jgi:hypothetical protein
MVQGARFSPRECRRSIEPLHFVVVTVDMGGHPESAEAKKTASRPLLAAGPPMNTSRGDTSRGNQPNLEFDTGDIEISMKTSIPPLATLPPIIAKCNGFASEKCSRQ